MQGLAPAMKTKSTHLDFHLHFPPLSLFKAHEVSKTDPFEKRRERQTQRTVRHSMHSMYLGLPIGPCPFSRHARPYQTGFCRVNCGAADPFAGLRRYLCGRPMKRNGAFGRFRIREAGEARRKELF